MEDAEMLSMVIMGCVPMLHMSHGKCLNHNVNLIVKISVFLYWYWHSDKQYEGFALVDMNLLMYWAKRN